MKTHLRRRSCFSLFYFHLTKGDQLLARAQQTDWFNNCLNINYYIKRSKCSSKIIHSNYSRNLDFFFYFLRKTVSTQFIHLTCIQFVCHNELTYFTAHSTENSSKSNVSHRFSFSILFCFRNSIVLYSHSRFIGGKVFCCWYHFQIVNWDRLVTKWWKGVKLCCYFPMWNTFIDCFLCIEREKWHCK